MIISLCSRPWVRGQVMPIASIAALTLFLQENLANKNTAQETSVFIFYVCYEWDPIS